MAAVKRPPLPVILVANDLLEGDVVFAAAEGWTRDPREASVAHDDAQALALESFAAGEFRLSRIVDPYLVDVTLNAEGLPVPRHYREVLRTLGPSNRLDLGKQADFQI
jgi:sulfite reductase (NADPH) hemoprotein beta-component